MSYRREFPEGTWGWVTHCWTCITPAESWGWDLIAPFYTRIPHPVDEEGVQPDVPASRANTVGASGCPQALGSIPASVPLPLGTQLPSLVSGPSCSNIWFGEQFPPPYRTLFSALLPSAPQPWVEEPSHLPLPTQLQWRERDRQRLLVAISQGCSDTN